MTNTSGAAITSLVFGILSIILGWVPLLGWATWIIAIVLGLVALNNIKKNRNLSGRRLAIAGLILGIIAFVLYFLSLIIIGAIQAIQLWSLSNA